MKKTERRLLILSVISIALSAITIILLIQSYNIALKEAVHSEYYNLYYADINTYYTYVILEYIFLIIAGITGIIVYSISAKCWLLYISSTICLISFVYASVKNGFTPRTYPTFIIPFLFIIIANNLSEHYKKTNT
jgi:hypothetical protein